MIKRPLTDTDREPVGPTLIHAMHVTTEGGRVLDVFLFREQPRAFLRYVHPDGWHYDFDVDAGTIAAIHSAANSDAPGAKRFLQGLFNGIADYAASLLAGETKH